MSTEKDHWDWLVSDGAGVFIAAPAIVGPFLASFKRVSTESAAVELQHRSTRREDAEKPRAAALAAETLAGNDSRVIARTMSLKRRGHEVEQEKDNAMKDTSTNKTKISAIAFAILVTAGIGLMSAPAASAAPASGTVIGEAARATSPMTKVPCAMRRVCNRYGCRSVRRCW